MTHHEASVLHAQQRQEGQSSIKQFSTKRNVFLVVEEKAKEQCQIAHNHMLHCSGQTEHANAIHQWFSKNVRHLEL